jgi:hypothetical protein
MVSPARLAPQTNSAAVERLLMRYQEVAAAGPPTCGLPGRRLREVPHIAAASAYRSHITWFAVWATARRTRFPLIVSCRPPPCRASRPVLLHQRRGSERQERTVSGHLETPMLREATAGIRRDADLRQFGYRRRGCADSGLSNVPKVRRFNPLLERDRC